MLRLVLVYFRLINTYTVGRNEWIYFCLMKKIWSKSRKNKNCLCIAWIEFAFILNKFSCDKVNFHNVKIQPCQRDSNKFKMCNYKNVLRILEAKHWYILIISIHVIRLHDQHIFIHQMWSTMLIFHIITI